MYKGPFYSKVNKGNILLTDKYSYYLFSLIDDRYWLKPLVNRTLLGFIIEHQYIESNELIGYKICIKDITDEVYSKSSLGIKEELNNDIITYFTLDTKNYKNYVDQELTLLTLRKKESQFPPFVKIEPHSCFSYGDKSLIPITLDFNLSSYNYSSYYKDFEEEKKNIIMQIFS